MKRLIFLDIDGVLNSAQFRADNTNGEGVVIVNGTFDATSHIDPQRVARLNRLIETTNAEVVLSSSWRKLFGQERTQSSLKPKGSLTRSKTVPWGWWGRPGMLRLEATSQGLARFHGLLSSTTMSKMSVSGSD
jgi:hypothetical protein